MLKLPQLALATASVCLHRCFMRHAMALTNKPTTFPLCGDALLFHGYEGALLEI
jgi:hypothetical protein